MEHDFPAAATGQYEGHYYFPALYHDGLVQAIQIYTVHFSYMMLQTPI